MRQTKSYTLQKRLLQEVPLERVVNGFCRIVRQLRRKPQWLFLSFLLVVLAIYSKTLDGFFVWDEQRIILTNGATGYLTPSNIATFLKKGFFYSPVAVGPEDRSLVYYRPLTIFFFSLQYKAFGLFYPLYHMLSLLLHVLNATLLVIISAQLLKPLRPFVEVSAAAFWCGFIFLIHPRNAQTLCVISNQASLLDTCFGLFSLSLWMRYLRVRSPFTGGMAFLFFLLAVLCKESAYILPLLFLSTGVLWAKRADRGTKSWLMPWCVFPLMLWAVFSWKSHFVQIDGQYVRSAVSNIPRGELLSYLATVCQLFFVQCFSFFLPLTQPTFMLPFSCLTVSWQVFFFLVLSAATLVGVLWWGDRVVILGGVWFVLLYLPYSCLIPNFQFPGITLLISAHQVYSAMPGLILLSVYLAFSYCRRLTKRNHGRKKWVLGVLLMCWIGFLLARSFCVAERYTNAEGFYEHIIEEEPTYVMARLSYAWHLWKILQDEGSAEYELCQAREKAENLRFSPEEQLAANALVRFYGEKCALDEAQGVLDRVRDRWIRLGKEAEYLQLRDIFMWRHSECWP